MRLPKCLMARSGAGVVAIVEEGHIVITNRCSGVGDVNDSVDLFLDPQQLADAVADERELLFLRKIGEVLLAARRQALHFNHTVPRV
jgi:hypothetical protein